MTVIKEDLINSLYKIMCTATSTASDSKVTNNDYFKRRVLGFRAEIEFSSYINSLGINAKLIDGGQFISTKLNGHENEKNSFIYTTVSDKEPSGFLEIYSLISKWSEVSNLIYIKYDPSSWSLDTLTVKEIDKKKKSETNILIPKYVFYIYDKTQNIFIENREQSFKCILDYFSTSTRAPNVNPLRKRDQFDYFSEYSLPIITNIYANRYFLDVILRKASGRQIIDFDGFLKVGSKINIIEIKEKSPIKDDSTNGNDWQYGWDSRRILWYLYIQKQLNLDVIYNVRQIDNRKDRNFIKWDCIKLDKFLTGVSWSNSRGGGGGEDTLLAPYSYFKDIREII